MLRIPASAHCNRFNDVIALALALLLPSTSFAHPGHETSFVNGLLHPFLGWDHLLAALAVGVWAVRLGGRSTWCLPLAFVGAMLAGTALGMPGLGVPMSEAGIALSLAILGLAIALDARVRLALGAFVVVLFALFHGSAHGAEAAENLALYGLGLALGTMLIHGLGIGSAVALNARPAILRIAAAPLALAGLALLALRLQ